MSTVPVSALLSRLSTLASSGVLSAHQLHELEAEVAALAACTPSIPEDDEADASSVRPGPRSVIEGRPLSPLYESDGAEGEPGTMSPRGRAGAGLVGLGRSRGDSGAHEVSWGLARLQLSDSMPHQPSAEDEDGHMPECMSCAGAAPVSERGSMDGRFSPEMSQAGDALPGEQHRSKADTQPGLLEDGQDDEHEEEDDEEEDGSVRSAQAARDARTVMTLHSIDEAHAFEFDDMDEPTGPDEPGERSSFSRIAMERDVGASDLGGHAFSVANAHARMTEPDVGAADVGPDHQDVPGSPLAARGSRGSGARPPTVPSASTPTSPHSRARGFRMRGPPKATLSSSASVVSDGRTVASTMAQRPFSPELPSHKRDDTLAPSMAGASGSSRADSPGITPSALHEPAPGGMASLARAEERDSDDDCSCASDAGVTVNTARAARPRQSLSRSSSRSSGASSIGPQSLGETPLEALLVSHPGEHADHAPGRTRRAMSGGPAGNASDSVVAVQGMHSGRAGTSVYSRGSGLGATARATTAGCTSVSGISQVTSRASCTSLHSESSHSEYSAEQDQWHSAASHPGPSADQSSAGTVASSGAGSSPTVLWYSTGVRAEDIPDAKLYPMTKQYTVTGMVRRIPAADKPQQLGVPVSIDADQSVTLFKYGATVIATGSRCPHAGGILAQGDITDIEDMLDVPRLALVCPVHKYSFRLDDGSGISLFPPDAYCLPMYAVREDPASKYLFVGVQSAMPAAMFTCSDF